MNGSECEFAKGRPAVDEEWRRHAGDCADCGEILKVAEWMNRFADRTAAPRTLPSPGLLLFKAKLRERVSSSDRAEQPMRAMTFIALSIAIVAATGVAFGTESRLGPIVIEALGLIATLAAVIIAAAIVGAVVCLAFGYLLKRSGS